MMKRRLGTGVLTGVACTMKATGANNQHFAHGCGGGLAAAMYSVGDEVEVLSASKGTWMDAKVTAVHRDGSCDVKYHASGQIKQVPVGQQATMMKRRLGTGVLAGVACHAGAAISQAG